jgi:hypothetical protein
LLLTTRVIERAVANGFLLLRATTMWENVPARAPMHRLGFRPWSSSNGLIELELPMIPRRTAGHTGGVNHRGGMKCPPQQTGSAP